MAEDDILKVSLMNKSETCPSATNDEPVNQPRGKRKKDHARTGMMSPKGRGHKLGRTWSHRECQDLEQPLALRDRDLIGNSFIL